MSSERVAVFAQGSKMPADHGDYVLQQRLGQPSDEGAVYHAKYRTILDCAIKYIEPASVDKKVIENEVKLLSLLRHTHLVGINDFGVGAPQPPADTDRQMFRQTDQYFYIAMEYVPGQPLDLTWSHAKAAELVNVLDQLLAVVVYLHDRGVLHMDLKPKNVLIEPDSGNLVLIDLGFSLVADRDRFRDGLKLTEEQLSSLLDTDDVYVASTQQYTHSSRLHYLHHKIKREEIRRHWFPTHDLYAIGLIIQEAIKSREHELGSIGAGLQIIATHLIEGHYSSAGAARADLQKLQPHFLAPLGIPEFSLICETGRLITTSTGTVQATDRIVKLISHPFLQRLRLIPQLEFEYLLYPDARHSRFSHSLLVYDFCREALTHLLRDPHFRLAVTADDLQGTLLLSLLHDIGHYPLSHMFEDFRGHYIPMADRIFGDEDLFPLFFSPDEADPIVALMTTKRGEHPALGTLISDLFSPGTLEVMLSIAACANKETSPVNPIHCLLAGLISSAVDIDKVAYLTADSSMTGVPYGTGIDRQTFMSALVMPPVMAPTENHLGRPIIAVGDKALAAVESIVMARYWMLSRVYWHHTNRAIMAAFKFVITQLVSARQLMFGEYLNRTFWSTEADAMNYLVQLFDANFTSDRYYNPLHGLVNGNRDIYKRLVTLAAQDEGALYEKLIEHEEAAPGVILDALGLFIPKKELKVGVIIVDVPRKQRDTLDAERIRIVTQREGAKGCTERGLETSPLIAPLRGEFLNEVKKCRIFIARPVYRELEGAGRLDDVRTAVRRAIKTSLG